MASTVTWYGDSKTRVYDGRLDFAAATLEVVPVGFGYTPNPTSETTWADISTNDVSTGMGGAVALTTKSKTNTGLLTFDLVTDDKTWTVPAATTVSYTGFVVKEPGTSGRLWFFAPNELGDRSQAALGKIIVDFLPNSSGGGGGGGAGTIVPSDSSANLNAQRLVQFHLDLRAKTGNKRFYVGTQADAPADTSGATRIGEFEADSAAQGHRVSPFLLGAEVGYGSSANHDDTVDRLVDRALGTSSSPPAGHTANLPGGCVPMFACHWDNVKVRYGTNGTDGQTGTAASWDNATPGVDFNALLTWTSGIGKFFFDNFVVELGRTLLRWKTKSGDRACLVRLWHERNGNGSWWSTFNPFLGAQLGGNPALLGELEDKIFDYFHSLGLHNLVRVCHWHEYDPWGYDVSTKAGQSGVPSGASWLGGNSVYGATKTGYEAFSENLDGDRIAFDIGSCSVYFGSGGTSYNWNGKLDNAIMAFENAGAGRAFILGELGPSGSGVKVDPYTDPDGAGTSKNLLQSLKATYVPTTGGTGAYVGKKKGSNTSGLTGLASGWMWWWGGWRLDLQPNAGLFLADAAHFGIGEGVAP